MKTTDSNLINEQYQIKNSFEYLGLYIDDSNSSMKLSSIEYTKNWNRLSYGLILKQAIHLHTQWIQDDKMIVNDNDNEHIDNYEKSKNTKSNEIILDQKYIPEEFHHDSELLKYWLQRYRLFSKFDEGIILDRGRKFQLF